MAPGWVPGVYEIQEIREGTSMSEKDIKAHEDEKKKARSSLLDVLTKQSKDKARKALGLPEPKFCPQRGESAGETDLAAPLPGVEKLDKTLDMLRSTGSEGNSIAMVIKHFTHHGSILKPICL
jgi:hypothetical protein